jgi:hypothetical protein
VSASAVLCRTFGPCSNLCDGRGSITYRDDSMIAERMLQLYGQPLSKLEVQLASYAEAALRMIGRTSAGYTIVVWRRQDELEAMQFDDDEALLRVMDDSEVPIREFVKPLGLGEVRVLVFGDETFYAMHVIIPEKLH